MPTAQEVRDISLKKKEYPPVIYLLWIIRSVINSESVIRDRRLPAPIERVENIRILPAVKAAIFVIYN